MQPPPMYIHIHGRKMVEREDLRRELRDIVDRVFPGLTDDVAGAEVDRVDICQVEDNVLTCDGPFADSFAVVVVEV